LKGSFHTIKENEEVLLVASKEIRLEVNAEKTKYIEAARSRFDPRNMLP
jgi:hypothetical protein